MNARHPQPRPMRAPLAAAALAALAMTAMPPDIAQASSHREAPFVTQVPKVDGTDFYMFRSYEPGRSEFVTLLANYLPLQDPYGGPSYFSLDPNGLYEIHIDNNGDGREDLTFQFRVQNRLQNPGGATLNIGGEQVAIPLQQILPGVSQPRDPKLNMQESFTVSVVRGDRRTGTVSPITRAGSGATVFDKPVDHIGTKTIPNYAAYAAQHIYSVNIPGCSTPAKVFVGQRKDPFALNLGVIFDLVNAGLDVITNPALIGAAPNIIDDKNVTTLALEVHRSCLTAGDDPVIGGWTSASLRQTRLLNPVPPQDYAKGDIVGGAWVQVSRLGMPLVNEVVIGLKDKDRFNHSHPRNDSQFARYVTNPTLPALLELALGIPNTAPTNFPRNDLVTTFLTGIPGVNQPRNVVPAEMLRLNTAIAPVPREQQNRLGIVGEILRVGGPQNISQAVDLAGYPNGRRPIDDIVDISLVAVMGGLCVANGDNNALGFGSACRPAAAPLGAVAFRLHDAVDQAVIPLLPTFPYLFTPMPGAGTP